MNYDPTRLNVRVNSVSIHYSNHYPNFDYSHVIVTLPYYYGVRLVRIMNQSIQRWVKKQHKFGGSTCEYNNEL